MNLNEKTMQKAGVVVGLAVLANLLWSSAAPIIKTGYELLQVASDDTASQILFAGIRFFLAGILTIVLGSLINGRLLVPGRSALPKIGVLSIFQTMLQYTLFYIGCAHAPGVKVSIATSTSVFISILLSSLLFHQEKLTARKMLGCVLGFSGVVLVNLSSTGGFDLSISLAGEGAIILSSMSFALSNTLTKAYSKTENPVLLSGYQFILGGAVMVTASLLFGGRLPHMGGSGLLIILYLAMVSAVAFSLTSTLMKYNPVSRVTVFGFLNPVLGVILSMIILGESGQEFGLKGLIALLLVCIGVVTVNYNKERQ